MIRFADIHHHLIYAVDDGAQTEEDMQNMLRKAWNENIHAIVATPHVTPGVHHFPWDRFDRHMQKARDFCRSNEIGIDLYKGCEILYTDMTPDYLQEEKIPTLAGTDFVLVEFSPDDTFDHIENAVDRILCSGCRPIVAHCERYMCLQRKPKLVQKLKDNYDVRMQVNCGTLVVSKGFWMDRFVRFVFENGLIDALATDAHNVTTRAVRMKAAYSAVKKAWGREYAVQLTNGSVLEG